MRNEQEWRPTKFVETPRGLRGSRDVRALGRYSRIPADLVAGFYDRAVAGHARGRLLDLGCGTVPLYGAYRPHVAAVTCVDWSNSLHAVSHVDVEHDLADPLPFPDAAFDTVILSDVLEHLPEPAMLWAEMARVLAPGGAVILNVPFLYWLHEMPHDHHRYTEFALRRLAERAGFDVVVLDRLGGAADVVVDLISKAIHPYRFGGATMRALQWLSTRFAATGPGRRFRRRTGATMPLGYGMVARRG